MHKSEVVRARIEPDIKHNAEEILKNLGLSSSQAIGLFYKQIIFSQGLPFDLKIGLIMHRMLVDKTEFVCQ